MQLYQLNQHSYPESIENTWQHSLQKKDVVILIEEAILRTVSQKKLLKALIEDKGITLYYLQADAQAYGMSPSIGKALDDEQWADITLSADANISW